MKCIGLKHPLEPGPSESVNISVKVTELSVGEVTLTIGVYSLWRLKLVKTTSSLLGQNWAECKEIGQILNKIKKEEFWENYYAPMALTWLVNTLDIWIYCRV